MVNQIPNSMKWYVVYTKPKQEDLVTKFLNSANITVYNPKLKKKKIIKGMVRNWIEPLFPCYVFSMFDPLVHYKMIKYTRGVKKVLGDDISPWSLQQEVIDIINLHTSEEGYIELNQNFKPGDSVVIKEGPLKGFMGVFEKELSGEKRVSILLDTLKYQASVTIEKYFLSKF